MNNKDTLTKIGVAIVLVFILVVGRGIFRKNTAPPTSTTATTTSAGDLTTLAKTGKVTIGTTPALPKVPSLDRALPASVLDSAAQKVIAEKIAVTVAALKKNPTSFDDWIALGIERKQWGDYEGATEAWGYASVLSPKNIVSFGNLGDLYENFLKDYAKAETNLRMVVANDPHFIAGYRNLYDFYTLYQVNTTKAAAVVALGLKNNPGNPDLLALQKATP